MIGMFFLMSFGKVEDCIFALHRAVLDDQHHNAFLEKVAAVDVGEVAILQNNEQLKCIKQDIVFGSWKMIFFVI